MSYPNSALAMSRMKLYLILGVCIMCTLKVYSQGWTSFDFRAVNALGDTIPYLYTQGDSTSLTVSQMINQTSWYKTDSLVIPEIVTQDNKNYIVKKISTWCFANGPEHVKKLHLPKTYNGLDSATLSFVEDLNITSPFTYSPFEDILVAEDNPYYKSDDGVLYSKDESILIAYPRNKKKHDSFIIGENVLEVANGAFFGNHYIKELILPNTLKKIQGGSFVDLASLEELVLKDSVENIETCAFVGHVPRLIFGKGVSKVSTDFIYNPESKMTLICHAIIPPAIYLSSFVESRPNVITFHDSIYLYVPRRSVNLYQQAIGWKDCASILPIEPPIVTGVDTASVSWVQNFSATGYVWTLYTDEARTQRFMSLTFDANGHLTHIDLNSGHMPARMPALYHEDGEGEKRFAEYYSFTISGLSPDTKYYYTRQSMNGTEVIDEETGSFETLSEAPEGTDEIGSEGGRTTRKIMEDGQVLIKRGKTTYTLQGTKMK